jgi:hypothetical protein
VLRAEGGWRRGTYPDRACFLSSPQSISKGDKGWYAGLLFTYSSWTEKSNCSDQEVASSTQEGSTRLASRTGALDPTDVQTAHPQTKKGVARSWTHGGTTASE